MQKYGYLAHGRGRGRAAAAAHARAQGGKECVDAGGGFVSY